MTIYNTNGKPVLAEKTVTIADSETTSGATFIGGDLVAIRTDSGLETGTITFTSSTTSAGTFLPVKDASNTAISIDSAAASTHYVLNPIAIQGLGYVKLVSATSQTGATTITLIIKPWSV